MTSPRVVIVGGGFAGIEAARALAKYAETLAPVDIILVDRQNHHCFQPLLYQVATAALSPADIAWPIRSILNRQPNLRVIMAKVTGVDTQARIVHTDELDLPYDYLVLASGVTHAYFGHDEWESVAPGLKQLEDARHIRARFLLAFERAEIADDEALRRKLLTFVIVGGGPTGVEMAGSMAEVAKETLKSDFREIDPRMSRIVLIEAGPRILPALPENLSNYAQRALEKMGVEVLVNTKVTDCDADGVSLGDTRIDASTIVWAAGVVASPAAQWIHAEHDRAGRIMVAPDLSVPGLQNVFVAGDLASVKDQDGKPVPGIAPAAKQMGRYIGRLIAARVAGETDNKPFVYSHAGDLATVGRRAAVVKIGRFELTGFIGWLFWGIAHIYFLIGLRNRFVVAVTWLWSYLTFRRGARLISTGDNNSVVIPEGARRSRVNPRSV
ncbi:NAD(P)/FAD-dependent oxidoreductase [Pseudorhodoplanes sinuspersici]|uniref:NADH:ubiquinone reductase (non-electrogenic) n=1 Tax=Pseudorhodoplanes sinuspersici TaxID=1235591 RepID=A0A1W6ZPE3_9HYPH|nr:NAD(P)/FAD-dependent oxidoreductase [Pseudorhodoplanes sinuspersici]ARP99135.1 FAD-dependent oxidoreductase [Pseudorhodoplanes sinuspersici]RKE69212.1 NADH dehydrogenase [Pseudorhodoplanes sinuspersici]